MMIPCMVLVVDDGSPKAPSRVDTSSSDGDGCQVHQEHGKPNGKWSQDLHFNSNIGRRLMIKSKWRTTDIVANTNVLCYMNIGDY